MSSPFIEEKWDSQTIYLWHDGPMIFTVKNTETDCMYLANLCDRTVEQDEWLLTLVDKDMIMKLEKRILSIRESILQSKERLLVICKFSETPEETVVNMSSKEMTEDYLPSTDSFLC